MKQLINKNFKLLLLIIITGVALSCRSDDNDTKISQNDKTISQEIKNLIDYQGEENANTVIIHVQGGPTTELSTEQFYQSFQNYKSTSILKVNVHQAQTKDPSIVNKGEITFEKAIEYDNQSLEMLYKVVKYFKEQKRNVYVIGISYGAFLTQELIAKKGINTADKYLILVGRLDINEEFWKAFSEGNGATFEDGTKINFAKVEDPLERNLNKIAAGLGKNRYTQLFKNFDLSNVTYIYGKKDDAVGKLTDEEINFLQTKRAKVIAGEGDHGETIDTYANIDVIKTAFNLK